MSTFDETKVNRQAAGQSIGGQFAHKDQPTNDQVSLAEEQVSLAPDVLARFEL